jgi:hypothetical protein
MVLVEYLTEVLEETHECIGDNNFVHKYSHRLLEFTMVLEQKLEQDPAQVKAKHASL